MKARLVVTDPERTEKTICLAVSPAMKALGVKNRCRVFEIPQGIRYITAPPRMQKYIDYSAEIYEVYLSYVSKDDIHVYSIDEAFLDVTHYLPFYRKTARELALCIMADIRKKVGVPAACGIGTNLYLTKIALDIMAKHAEDFIGVLDEKRYQDILWDHRPLTDFWRIGAGTARTLERHGIYTMRDITLADEELLYRWFGVDAELLIDHAWGRETADIADIKAYRPKSNSLSSGQVLMRDYNFAEGRIIVREMMDSLCLTMMEREVVTDSVTLHVGYASGFSRKPAHGTETLPIPTNADALLLSAAVRLYERLTDPSCPVRRITLTCNRIIPECAQQISLFDGREAPERQRALQKAVLGIKHKYGKNAVLRGLDFTDAATARERNHQIGGHKSGE